MYRKSLEVDATDAESLSNLAAMCLVNQKPEQAIQAAKNALQQKVEAQTYVTLGSAYEMLRDFSNAKISFEKAIALGVANKTEIEDKIKSIGAKLKS